MKHSNISPSISFLVKNQFNHDEFDKAFQVASVTVDMMENDKIVYSRLHDAIQDFEEKYKIDVLSCVRENEIEGKQEKIANRIFIFLIKKDENSFESKINEFSSILPKQYVSEGNKISLMVGCLNKLKSSSESIKSTPRGTHFECTESEDLSYVQFFSLEASKCGSDMFVYPRLLRYTELTEKQVDNINSNDGFFKEPFKEPRLVHRFRLQKGFGQPYFVFDEKGGYTNIALDGSKKTLPALTTGNKEKQQRCLLLGKCLHELNEMVGHIFKFELEDLDFNEERVHKESDEFFEYENIKRYLKLEHSLIQIYFDPEFKDACKNFEDLKHLIIDCLEPIFDKVHFVSKPHEIKRAPVIAFTEDKCWYVKHKKEDPKEKIYQLSEVCQISDKSFLKGLKLTKKNGKYLEQPKLKKIIIELFWKTILSQSKDIQLCDLAKFDYIPSDGRSYLFIEAKKKNRETHYFNVMHLSKAGLSFSIENDRIKSIPDISNLMDASTINAIRNQEQSNRPFHCVVRVNRECISGLYTNKVISSDYVIIDSTKVVITPKNIYEICKSHERNRTDISFNLNEINEALERCDKKQKTYPQSKGIVERLESNFEKDMQFNYYHLIDQKGKLIKKNSQFFKNLYGDKAGEITMSKHHLKNSLLKSYYNSERGFYVCGGQSNLKLTNEHRFPNVKLLISNSTQLEKEVFNMTACYTLRGDKSATVYPAPFKLLKEYVNRQEILKQSKTV